MRSWFKRTGPPSPGDVVGRVIILRHLLIKGAACPAPQFVSHYKEKWGHKEWEQFVIEFRNQYTEQILRLRESGLWEKMDTRERDFLRAGPEEITHQDQIQMSWLAESGVCLCWALGYVTDLPPYDQEAKYEEMRKLPDEPLQVLIRTATLRRAEVIRKQRDLTELWHWRSRTRELQESGDMPAQLPGGMNIDQVIAMASAKAAADGGFLAAVGGDFPAFGKSYRDLNAEEFSRVRSIAMERHRAFNWLCGYSPDNRWLDTPTDT